MCAPVWKPIRQVASNAAEAETGYRGDKMCDSQEELTSDVLVSRALVEDVMSCFFVPTAGFAKHFMQWHDATIACVPRFKGVDSIRLQLNREISIGEKVSEGV